MRGSEFQTVETGLRRCRSAGCGSARWLLLLGTALLALGLSWEAIADDDELFEQNRTTYGDLGILEMPSARMAPDGQVSLTIGDIDATQWRVTGGFQVLPWLEGTFRYSHIPHFFNSGDPVFDRSFGVKMRLFQETAYTPAVAVGVRDLIGTGIFGAEYVVLSKRFWTIDFTAGLGWGRLSSTEMFPNPFGIIFQSFNTRSTNTGQGGTIGFGQLFHGPDTSAFGGINWQTPIDGLDFLVEYSSDRYLQERTNTHFFTRMPVNVGLSYRVLDNLSLSGGWLYGTTWGAIVSFHFDPKKPLFLERFGPPPVLPAIRTAQQQETAVTSLTQNKNQLNVLMQGTPSATLMPDSADTQAVMAAAPSSAMRDYEIDGHTLTVNVQGPADMDAQCRIFAQVAARWIPGIDSVAVADLSDHDGKVTICSAKKERRVAALNAASVLADNLQGDQAQPVDNGQSFQFKPAVASPTDVEHKIREDARSQNLDIEAVSIEANVAVVYVSNTKYYFETEAVGRLTRVLLADAPPNVEVFRIISVYHGVPIRETKILRTSLERVLNLNGSAAEIRDAVALAPAPLENPVLDAQQDDYPRFGWSIYPRVAKSFFDPKSPARFGIFADVSGYTELFRGFTLETVLEGNIWNNLAGSPPSNSLLPHVRSDFNLYYEHGSSGISSLDAVYRTRLTGDVFAEVKAGYLEDMFMGAGGQVLWRPEGDRWAIGADIYQVWQRNFDRLFGARSYNIATGHVSVYYESPWYGINVAVHVGRYLAGDWGGTLQISRRFEETGIEIGAYATFTNVPFSQFGEGSFDKGVIIRIPLQWFVPIDTQSVANLDFKPLTRDGGQRLLNDDSLYDETQRTSYGQMDQHLNAIVTP